MQNYSSDGCVLTCTAAECSYNQDLECHAQQIQVGDDHPTCDTYTTGQASMFQRQQQESIVATCMVAPCNFNSKNQCQARGITVDHHAQHADCVTFRP